MYRIPIYKIMLVRDSSQATERPVVKVPADVVEIARQYLAGIDREAFAVILLDTKNKIIGINTVGIGALNFCAVHPREVFKPAILANAAAVICFHNHPSGDPAASREDLILTKRLVEAGEALGINILDHIILGEANFCSLKETGQI